MINLDKLQLTFTTDEANEQLDIEIEIKRSTYSYGLYIHKTYAFWLVMHSEDGSMEEFDLPHSITPDYFDLNEVLALLETAFAKSTYVYLEDYDES